MTLYTPAHFAVADRVAVARLMHDHPFATLITPGTPEPHISHLPLLLVPGMEPHGMLLGHFARANPHWQHAVQVESVALFQGPHAYVSPRWYAHPARMVPTWNYVAVHAHGTLDMIDDPAEKRHVLDVLAHRFEHARPDPWHFDLPPRERDAMVGAIVAFRLRIRRLEAKFKLAQNRSQEDRGGVVAGLRAERNPEAAATADWMEACTEAWRPRS